MRPWAVKEPLSPVDRFLIFAILINTLLISLSDCCTVTIFCWFQKNIVWIQNTRVWTIPSNQVMSTPDETKPWFMNWVGTSPIVIIWYFFKVPSQLNRRLGFINPGLTLNINVFLLWRKHRTKPWTFVLLVKQQKWTCQAAKRTKVSWTKWVWLNKCYLEDIGLSTIYI